MPIVESLKNLTENREPLGKPIPPYYTERAEAHELTTRFSTVSLSHRLSSLLRDANENRDEPPITVKSIIQASRPLELKQMRWQSFRLDDEGKPLPDPTGWEHLYIDRGMDNVDIVLRIALVGLQAQAKHPDVINRILNYGFGSLNLSQLEQTQSIIGELLDQEKKDMTKGAKEFRRITLREIRELPKDLTTSYYYRGDDDQIIAIANVVQRLPPHSSFRRPLEWQEVFKRAQDTDPQHMADFSVQDLERGRHIIELLSHGMGSFSQGFVRLISPTQKQ